MDIHGLFEEAIGRAPYEYAADVIEKRFQDAGFPITKKERKEIVRQLRMGRLQPLTRDKWRFWDRRIVTIPGPSEEDLAAIEARLKDLLDRIPEIAIGVIEATSPKIAEMVKKEWLSNGLQREQELVRAHRSDVWKIWREPLQLLWLVVDLGCRTSENIARLTGNETERPHAREVMVRLHTRGVRISKEILSLLQSGFADGAAARWRTLHETTVVAYFISKHGEDCARRYLAHDAVELHRAAKNYIKCSGKLGQASLPDEDLATINQEYAEVVAEFGTEFRKEYGWAAPFLAKKRITFVDLEAEVDFASLRFDYGLASQEVHAGARALFANLGIIEESMLLRGPSVYGLSDPGSNTARSLILLTATCVQVHPIMDAQVSSYLMMLLGEEASRLFTEVESRLDCKST